MIDLSEDNQREVVRIFDKTIVVGKCMDCGAIFHGYLGVRFIETPEGPGIEITVSNDNTAHALGRVQLELVPTVQATLGENTHESC
jgi:hypothetical protein